MKHDIYYIHFKTSKQLKTIIKEINIFLFCTFLFLFSLIEKLIWTKSTFWPISLPFSICVKFPTAHTHTQSHYYICHWFWVFISSSFCLWDTWEIPFLSGLFCPWEQDSHIVNLGWEEAVIGLNLKPNPCTQFWMTALIWELWDSGTMKHKTLLWFCCFHSNL